MIPLAISLFFTVAALAQEPVSAQKGVTYGAGISDEPRYIASADLSSKMKKDKYTGKMTGKVTEVCKDKGCWMKVEGAEGETIMVKFKDYKFFMPKDIVGKEVMLEGEASYKEVSVKQLKHYAEDAGKSPEEIKQITQPKKELQFVAKGVQVL